MTPGYATGWAEERRARVARRRAAALRWVLRLLPVAAAALGLYAAAKR